MTAEMPAGLGGSDDRPHVGKIPVVDDGVDGEIALDAFRAAERRNVRQVFDREAARCVRAHVERADPEVDAVGARLQGRGETFARACGSHDFKVRSLHDDLPRQVRLKAQIVADPPPAFGAETAPLFRSMGKNCYQDIGNPKFHPCES